MTAAIALAVVLVIAVAGASMAMESQRAGQPGAVRRPARPARPVRSPRPTRAGEAERSRRPLRNRGRSTPAPGPTDAAPPPPPPVVDPEPRGPELLRTGTAGEAKVISVVDERTIGPVTRSRLTLRVDPAGGDAFEVTVRHAFQTPESRSKVKVGGTIPVRYDAGERRVVVDLPQDQPPRP